ncbi:hypothetical protein UCD39_19150 [Nitrospirillum sp. BR 11752]|uniref:hypothetical protein n=1 Tax=Nitrospirillum sp. BR 11752 TaxID=3104293 RepID=UPI002EC41036|nr:hypothetical protein [Nitrospirillum sp. BR 11752]
MHIALGAIGSAAVATAKVVEQQQKPCTVTRSTIMIPGMDQTWALLNDYPAQPGWRRFATAQPTTRQDGQTVWQLETATETRGFFLVRRRETFIVVSSSPYELVHRMLAPIRGERRFLLERQQGHGRLSRLTVTWTGALYHRKRLVLEADRLIRDLTAHFHRAR